MKKLAVLVSLALSVCINISAQASYMHEAAEDSEGGGILGVLSLLIFIGVGTLISNLFSNENPKPKSNRYKKNIDGNINLHTEYSCQRPKTEAAEEKSKQILAGNSDKLAEEKRLYRKRVIDTYARETECFGFLGGEILIIKEDGEYHFLDYLHDERHIILRDYIKENIPENWTSKSIRFDWLMFDFYMGVYSDEFPSFNLLEKANVEPNDFLGGKLAAIKAYYSILDGKLHRYPIVHRVDFFMSIGLEETILLHKIIKRPMEAEDWFDMQVMRNRGLKTYDEYRKYRNSAGQWHEEEDGWYDKFYGYLAPTLEEARAVFIRKEGCSYPEASKAVKSIKWEYDG